MTVTRRAALGGGLAGGLGLLASAACTGERAPDRPAPVDPDVALRAAAVARERALAAAYDAVLRARPELAATLGPVAAEHSSHLTVLGQTDPATPAAVATTSPVETLAALVQAERDAAAAHAAAALDASPALAAVLAQLAASEASHPVALA